VIHDTSGDFFNGRRVLLYLSESHALERVYGTLMYSLVFLPP
jgi:hypothetical protein